MHLQQRINAFVALGKFLGQFTSEEPFMKTDLPHNELFFEDMQRQINLAKQHNGWFTDENLQFSFKNWSIALQQEHIEEWINTYDLAGNTAKTIGIVMAGNLPLVGFHDFLCVLITGNEVIAKLSSKDKQLLPIITKYLIALEPGFEAKVRFTEERLKDFNAVIATGSNNTAKYFNYYFGKYPSIIRKNRNSVAVLDGSETKAELALLANDIFRYFGLGCRNVSKLYIPRGYNFDDFFQGMFSWKDIIQNTKFMNNYDYNKAVYLMSNIALLDNEFSLLKEDKSLASPIAVIFYQYYDSMGDLNNILKDQANDIQCVVSKIGVPHQIAFGQTQQPELGDYADRADTVDFLLKL